MRTITLDTAQQLQAINSSSGPQAILKHNTTCPISKGVLERLQEDEAAANGIEAIHVLDLLAHRELSNTIASEYGVPHQSPQVLIIRDGRCIYHEWGFDITAEAINESLK